MNFLSCCKRCANQCSLPKSHCQQLFLSEYMPLLPLLVLHWKAPRGAEFCSCALIFFREYQNSLNQAHLWFSYLCKRLWPNQTCKVLFFKRTKNWPSFYIANYLLNDLLWEYTWRLSSSTPKSEIKARCLFSLNRPNKSHYLWRSCHNLLDCILVHKDVVTTDTQRCILSGTSASIWGG